MVATTATDVTPDSSLVHDRRIARSRAKMLAAATELLIEAGPRAVTVDAVAERSGVAKSTLYRHWGSVTELLVDVMRANIPTITPIDTAAGFETALRELMGHIATTLSTPEWARIIPALVSLRRHMPEMAELFETDWSEKVALVGQVIDLGIAEGSLPPGVDHRLATQLLLGPLVLATISGDDAQAVDLARHVVDRFLASYRADTRSSHRPKEGRP